MRRRSQLQSLLVVFCGLPKVGIVPVFVKAYDQHICEVIQIASYVDARL